MASSSSTTPPPAGQRYEVFLSFSGETRYGFTSHLYKKLYNAGISVFRDKEGLPVGEENWPELVKAIEASKISIAIISPRYASSKWCPNELVQILKCKKTSGQLVKPIFYHVKPSNVRKQEGKFGEEFQQLIKEPDSDDALIQEWKNALMEVSYLTAYESEKIADGYEAELVDEVFAEVLKALEKTTLDVDDSLVGIKEHAEEIMKMVDVKGSNDARAILIHGMGGIGKTTLAKVVYNRLSNHFQHCSYIANIREASSQYKGKEGLQKQLIEGIFGEKWPHDISNIDEGVNILRYRFNRKKVLLLLDDIDQKDQFSALVRKDYWFGEGSILIITSRRNDVLEGWEGSFNYELNGLNVNQSLELFRQHAFKGRDSIPDGYDTIAKEIVIKVNGLPLAIKVIGSLLYGKPKDTWKENLEKLKEIPHSEVQRVLKISFDALEDDEKEIFLDIACLPLDKSTTRYAFYMWNSFGFHPQVVIEKLEKMSLIKIVEEKEFISRADKEINMHDQLKDLGRDIVRKENINDPGERSRLWKPQEAWDVLSSKQVSSFRPKCRRQRRWPSFQSLHKFGHIQQHL